jgi:hypothetical protein
MDSNYSFEDADFLLKRDWFMSVEDIEDLLWELHQDVFDKVLEQWLSYSYRIQDVLSPYVVREQKVKDLTDDMMNAVYLERENQMRKKWDELRKNFIPPPRPRTALDERYEELKIHIEKLEKEQPKSRASRAQNTENIQKVKNELEKIEGLVISQDTTWAELQWLESVVPAREKLIYF